MAKTNYQVTFNGKVVGIRKSDRIYTHAVVVQDDADAFYHWAHNYVPNETDRKNFAYDSKRAVQIVEQYLAEWKYLKPDYVESQISEAKAKVEGGFEAYAERLRQEKIQMYEDKPLLVIGEAKSFGKNAISEDAVIGLRKVADRFPGAIMIVSTLREIGDYTADELQRLRDLALWGRREVYHGQPTNPLVVLTATELFARHGIFDAWKEAGGAGVHPSINPADLHALAELTQKRYLDLPGFWEERMKARDLGFQRQRLMKLIQGRTTR